MLSPELSLWPLFGNQFEDKSGEYEVAEDKHGTALPRHVEEAVSQISAIHRANHFDAKPSERLTDRAVAIMGTPTFFAIIATLAGLWMLGNGWAGSTAIDVPPYPILEMLCSLVAILLSILILAAQRRDDRLATRRERMAL